MNDRDRFDRFTERARKVLSLAQEEAQRFQHNYIGTEHILLGLIREGEGVAARVLKDLGADLYQVRQAVEFIVGRGDRIVLGEIGLTPRAKKVIELAVDEAHRLNHHYIGTEHLLLGLVREGEGIAAKVLESFGIHLEQVRKSTLAVLEQPHTVTLRVTRITPSETAEGEAPAMMPPSPMPSSSPGDRFDRFTERARRVLSLAQEEAQHFHHNYIGTEHLLLGLVREDEGVAARVLKSMGVELFRVRQAVEFIIGRGDRVVLGEVGLTPRARRVIDLSIDEARRLNHHYIGTEHLLLGLVREGEGIAAGVLESLGANLERVRMATINVLSSSGTSARYEFWKVNADTIVLSDQDVADAQDEDDLTRAPAGEASEEKNLPGVFTVRSWRVLEAAEEEAHKRQQTFIGTEHLLLGLVREGKGLASLLFQKLGVDRETIRATVEFVIMHSSSRAIPDVTGFTPRSRKVIQHAVDEVYKLDHTLVSTEHLLLGMLREGEGIAAGVLISLGVTYEKIVTPLERRRRRS
ncbi:MAG TPA: Clp protease N-terminal domain-containing protein [Ktedonobacteraceae bacterium]|nr:Clp protease N-terminal domain-containing protein [Ktedonobacteraceae bacterium]